MKIVSQRWGEGKFHNRRAVIYRDVDDEFGVDCYENGIRTKQISCKGHSQYYAEDAAENWASGIIQPDSAALIYERVDDVVYARYRDKPEIPRWEVKSDHSESWDEEKTDERMNVIGQNGNDGLHYEELAKNMFETLDQEQERRRLSPKTRFDLEQEIMQCWNIVDEIKLIYTYHLDKRQLSEDELANILIGLEQLYKIKFETLFETFEACITKKEI